MTQPRYIVLNQSTRLLYVRSKINISPRERIVRSLSYRDKLSDFPKPYPSNPRKKGD